MTAPLAILLYEKVMPGSQLANRLKDMGYRVETVSQPDGLVPLAEQARPLVVLADLQRSGHGVNEAIAQLKQNPATAHVPVIAFGPPHDEALQSAARAAGAALVVSEAAIAQHLPALLDQALSAF